MRTTVYESLYVMRSLGTCDLICYANPRCMWAYMIMRTRGTCEPICSSNSGEYMQGRIYTKNENSKLTCKVDSLEEFKAFYSLLQWSSNSRER